MTGSGLHGVWAAALTPLGPDLAPDPARGSEHILRLLAAGCHGVVVFGTTGEAPSFSVPERMHYFEELVTAGVPPDRLIVGTGCPALPDTIALSRHAVEVGASGVLVLPPYFYQNPSEDGLYAAFNRIIAGVADDRLAVYLYNIPQQSGIVISPRLVVRLAASLGPAIAGVKDSTGDPASTAAFLPTGDGVFAGTENLLFPFLPEGLAGCITATGNVNPAGVRALYDAASAGDPGAPALHDQAVAVRAAFADVPMIPGLKSLVAHLRDDEGWHRVRPPFATTDLPDPGPLLARLARAGWEPPY